MKLIVMILTAIIAFFSFIFSPFLSDGSERTDFIVDGDYWGFSTSERTMTNFLALAEKNDAETIAAIFSKTAKAQSQNLEEKIPELIQFLTETMTSWESTTGMGDFSSVGGLIVKKQLWDYVLHTADVTYECTINEVHMDTGNTENEGFYSISICPEEFFKDCARYGLDDPGIYIFYPMEDPAVPDTMDTLASLSKAEDVDGIEALFSEAAKQQADDLPKQIDLLTAAFNDEIASWQFFGGLTAKDVRDGQTGQKRVWLFSVNMQDGTAYWCKILDFVPDGADGDSEGIDSIALYPEELRGQYSMLGWDTPGILRKQLTIHPSSETLTGGGVVTLTTSVEAAVTCDHPTITLTQKDPCTWETVLPDELDVYSFTAETQDESVSCKVTTHSAK